MILSSEQKINMQAIEWLEQRGNMSPTQAEIDQTERLIVSQLQYVAVMINQPEISCGKAKAYIN